MIIYIKYSFSHKFVHLLEIIPQFHQRFPGCLIPTLDKGFVPRREITRNLTSYKYNALVIGFVVYAIIYAFIENGDFVHDYVMKLEEHLLLWRLVL